MTLTQQQKDLLIGTLLGDGYLQSQTKGRTWRLDMYHNEKQKNYLFYKYDILKLFCDTQPILQQSVLPNSLNIYTGYRFLTRVHPSFRFYGNLFYTYNVVSNSMVKDVPINIEKFLTPSAIAFWYMDAGYLKWKGHSNAMVICTESFTEAGNMRLKKALKNLYDIELQLVKKSKKGKFSGYCLSVNEKNAKAFSNLIAPFIIPAMKYKVSDGNKGHL